MVSDVRMRICFEVSAMDNGEPCTFGMQMDIGETDKEVDYEQLARAVDVNKLIEVTHLDVLGVTSNAVRIITPQEYDELYDEEDEHDG